MIIQNTFDAIQWMKEGSEGLPYQLHYYFLSFPGNLPSSTLYSTHVGIPHVEVSLQSLK